VDYGLGLTVEVIMKTLLLLLLIGSANAQTIGLHLASAHAHGGYNNSNPGIYLRLDNGVTFGTYRNSDRRQSAYLAYTWESTEWHRFSAGLTAGGVTGYDRKVSPMLVPSVAFSGVRLGIVPRPRGGSSALHLMVEHRF
jgi:hypothetical protein